MLLHLADETQSGRINVKFLLIVTLLNQTKVCHRKYVDNSMQNTHGDT